MPAKQRKGIARLSIAVSNHGFETAADVPDNSRSQMLRRKADLWEEWKARVEMVRSALESRSADCVLSERTSGCLDFYKKVYSKQCNAEEALTSISGRGRLPLQIAFMWLGSWRPTSAITLVYSTLSKPLQGIDAVTTSSTDTQTAPAAELRLEQEQLKAMERLQKSTEATEGGLSNQLADIQMLLADQSMAEAIIVDATFFVSEKNWKKGRELMDIKVAALAHLFIQANELRLQTLEQLICLLSPFQSAHCCVTAFEFLHAIEMLR